MKIAKPIATFLEAVNKHNTDAFLSVISDTAVINDEGQDYRGIAEIKKWGDERVFGANVTLTPISSREQNDITIVSAKVDGSFDKTGLPDPLVMEFYFTIDSDKVIRLSIHLPNQRQSYFKALGFWVI